MSDVRNAAIAPMPPDKWFDVWRWEKIWLLTCWEAGMGEADRRAFLVKHRRATGFTNPDSLAVEAATG